MDQFKKSILPIYLLIISIQMGVSQNAKIKDAGAYFGIKVRVIDKSTNFPIENANVMINGREFFFNQINNYYTVRAKLGEELIVYHSDFEIVTHVITSNREIKIEVTKTRKRKVFEKTPMPDKSEIKEDNYFLNIDSANYYKNRDIDKSIFFIKNIIKEKNSDRRNAVTYKLLGDIYFEWKQYDLAVANYKNSLKYFYDKRANIQLAKAEYLFEDYSASEKTYLELVIEEAVLSKYEKIEVYEGVGNVSLMLKNYKRAKKYYLKALKIATDNQIIHKITDLNSKLGDVSAAEGKITEANTRFNNSIDLASKENPIRSIEEKDKVANYFNQTQQFDKEIDLRKQTLLETKRLNDSVLISNFNVIPVAIGSLVETDDKISGRDYINQNEKITSLDQLQKGRFKSINTQSINYKIGRAYIEKEDYNNAIPFLENSVKDAGKNNDLVVKKDATRKLSEAYADVGDYDRALKNYREYVKLVDTLYNRKEQEISQAERFGKKIADNQNRIASLEKDKNLSDSLINLAVKDQELVEERNKTQQIIIYSLMVGIVLMFILASLLLKNNKQQKLANNLLALKSMRSQMNPHFIFNALNSVNSFIAVNDERNANRYLSEFSVLMRSVLENSDEDFIPFTKEVELIELYVKLEHNRFKDKFEYTITVDESIALEEFSIPPMLLQPYIENAIWHGLRYKEESGTLKIEVRNIGDDSISVVIEDDGVGREKSMELKTKNQLKQKSKGMNTIQKRIDILNDMYQDRVDVQVSDVFEDGSGTKVELILKRK